MRRPALLLCCLALLPAAPALAAVDCRNGGATQTDMNICADQDFREADAALNTAYKKMMICAQAVEGGEKLMVEAQRAWLRYRDAECRLQGAAFEGGSAQPMEISGCLRAITLQRTKDLNALAGQNGALSCAPAH